MKASPEIVAIADRYFAEQCRRLGPIEGSPGLYARLTPKQKAAALAYRGPETIGIEPKKSVVRRKTVSISSDLKRGFR